MLAFHDFSILVSAILVTVVLSLLIELRYSKTVNFIAITGQLAVSMLVFLLLVSRNVERDRAALLALVLPAVVVFLLLARHRDSRFFFTICSVKLVGLIIVILARAVGIILQGNPIVVPVFMVTGLLGLAVYAYKCRREYLYIQRTMPTGWTSLASVFTMFYILTYVVVGDPTPLIQPRGYLLVALLFSITLLSVYAMVHQNITKTVKIADERKDRAVLEAKLALQESEIKLKEIYHRLAYTDILTGLKNRTAFEEKKRELRERLDRLDCLACLAMDINNMKAVNDLHGHERGDELLRDFAKILQQGSEALQNCYRVGGDEFTAFFVDNSEEEVIAQVRDLQERIYNYNCRHVVKIEVAMGIAFMSELKEPNLRTLISLADSRMYDNKDKDLPMTGLSVLAH